VKRTIILTGPPRSAGGGVLAFCDNMERAYTRLGRTVQRMWVGTGRGDTNDATETAHGVKGLLSSLPEIIKLPNPNTVLHINTSFTQKAMVRDAFVYLMARLKGSRVVVEYHGGLPQDLTDRLSRNALRTLSNADAGVVINEGMKRGLLALFPYMNGRLHLISNAIDLPKYDLEATISARYANPRLLYLSRIVVEKGLMDSIRALGLLKRQGVILPLDVAGDGPAMDEAKRIVKEEQLENQVIFHGRVAGEAKDKLFQQAAIFLLPTYYMEGQPISLIEALAWGIPSIVSNLEPVCSMVQDGVQAVHVPVKTPQAIADAVQRILADGPSYARMARADRALTEQDHELDQAAKRFLELYDTANSSQTAQVNA
jgi:glycosyltransferase involved in cell wall biosynthesis